MLPTTLLPQMQSGHSAVPVSVLSRAGGVFQVNPVLDTAIYADGDTLFATTVITDAAPTLGGLAELDSITVLDENDLGVALDLVFLKSNVALGVLNAAPNISDVDANEVLAIAKILTTDYADLGGCRVAAIGNIRRMLCAAPASRNIYVAGITRGGTPTYTASGLKFKFGLLW